MERASTDVVEVAFGASGVAPLAVRVAGSSSPAWRAASFAAATDRAT